MYMPDGGLQEDFLHVAGLLQVGAMNGTTRPFLLVGIENTERRRDLTGPTENARDRSIAPRVGGSAAFRRFLASELMPEVARRYRVTAERAIVGESLAGLFVIETFALEPDMFDIYVAIDPSLWWNNGKLAKELAKTMAPLSKRKSLFIATSSDGRIAIGGVDIAPFLGQRTNLEFVHRKLSRETHATVYHPAALEAFRTVIKKADPGK